MEQHQPFEIQTLEWVANHRPELFGKPRRSTHFEIIWIKRATGACSIDLEKYTLKENSVFCIDPGQLFCLQACTEIKGYHLTFSRQFLYMSEDNNRPLFETAVFTPAGKARIIPVDEELQTEMEEIAGKMIKEFTSYSLLRSEALKGLLKILMIYLTRKLDDRSPEQPVNRNCELLRKFMHLLETNLTRKKMVCDYASELSITPNHLNEIIKKLTGFPVNYHIQQRKILEAKRQVIYYGGSMKEIAYYLGFDDLSHFSKFFKNNTGLSFQKYKKEITLTSSLPV